MKEMEAGRRLCVALDFATHGEALRVADQLRDSVGLFKVGLELFSGAGPIVVRELVSNGCEVFLDLKYHDIPNTVAGAIRKVAGLGCRLIDLHASGGTAMMRAALEAARKVTSEQGAAAPSIIAVTVLTSFDDDTFASEVWGQRPIAETVTHYSQLAKSAGLQGVVASPLEIRGIRRACGEDFLIVVPGIRPSWAEAGDQKRTMTPAEAVREGADIIVVGRPITGSSDRASAAKRVVDEIHDAIR